MMRDFGYVPLEIRGDWGIRIREFTVVCFQLIRFLGITHSILDRIM